MTNTPKKDPLHAGILIDLKKIPAGACAVAALAGVAQAILPYDFDGSDHHRLEAIMPSPGEHHDDDPARTQVRELGERHAQAFTSRTSQMPFRQMDWPNPIAPPYPNDLRTWIQGPPLALVAGSNA